MSAKKILQTILIVGIVFFVYSGLIVRDTHARVYSSKNGKYTVEVKSDFSRDAGDAHYKVKDEDGEIISKFKTKLSPISMMPLNNGKRIIGFYGSVGRTVIITQLRFYSMEGKLIGKYGLFATGSGGQDITENGEYYVYSWRKDKKSGIDLFDTRSGKKIWSKTFKKLVSGVKISDDGQWVVAMFKKGGSKEIYLLDNEGDLKWSGSINTRNICAISSINEDGSIFEVTESKMVHDEEDGYMHRVRVKKIIYANNDGEVEIAEMIVSPR
ncbi:MAG: hypothetical protein KAR84_07880 [Elusimicrobiales bacterium]|nr:hypothetical protein [Elusimicrobiales bacterium]